MQRYFSSRMNLAIVFLCVIASSLISANSSLVLVSYSPALRRYPYLTDTVGSFATINWATDRSESAGAVRFGKVGTESCLEHYVPATRTPISVNGVLEYQWKALLNLVPGTQYCYRIYLGTSPSNAIDLLGGDSAPSFWTQVPSGANQSYTFAVIGDWGMVDSSGTNSYQASLMSLIASSGAKFVVTTGDNGYPDGNQKNLGDLIQTGLNISAIFGPSFWKVPGASLPLFPIPGNHGYYSPDANHPELITWPQDRAVTVSQGRYLKETYCCLDGTVSRSYPSVWYAFDVGPARFYLLSAAWDETNIGTASEYQVDYDYHWASNSSQYNWLQADLAAHPSVLKFAFFHYPLYSDNPTESTDIFLQGSNGLEGLLKQNGVDIAFTGHSHVYERNFASSVGLPNYVTGGGGATLGTLGTCTSLDAYAIKFTTAGKACGSAPMPTSAAQVFHFLLVTVNGYSVTVTPINSLGQSFDVINYNFSSGAETTPPTTPSNLAATTAGGTQINLSWAASSDNSGVRGYDIYRDGTLVGAVDQNTLTYSDKTLAPATTYTYQVDAFDGSTNHSTLSVSKSATTHSSAIYTLNPVADAYVASDLTTTNFGLSATLKADGSPTYHSYLRFNVGDLNGTVTSAALRLYTTSSSVTGFQVHRLLNQSWEEASINYDNAPAPGAVLNSSGGFASSNWISVDVSSFVTGNGVYDFVLTTSSSSNMNFNSREASSNQPQLVLQTSANMITSTPSQTPTATSSPSRTPTRTTTPVLTFTPSATPTATATRTITATPTATSPGTMTYNALADARVVESSPTTNYGTATTLQVDGDAGAAQSSYIRFAVSGVSGSIQSVKLRVYCTTNGSANGPAVYLADNNWIESGTGGITWNTQPALLSGVIDNKGSFGTSTWVEYDVTSLVTGNGTYTFALLADSTDGVTFSSREGTPSPQLYITLSTSAPTLTHIPTATQTSTIPAVNTPTLTATATVGSGGSLTFTTEADTRVVQASPTTNYGTSTNLQADGDAGAAQISYLRFIVSGITGSPQSVKLRVYCTTNGSVNGPAAYLADNNWVESGTGGVTWDTQPVLISGAFDNKGAITLDTWIEYDVTALVTGDGTYTFALLADSTDGVTFSSREGAAPPQLVVMP